MKLRALALAALAGGVMSISAASAAPALPKLNGISGSANVEQVQIRDKRRMNRDGRWNNKRRDYRRDGYRRGPPGWRRYSSRPRDWRTRGCIIVGPIWFCP